MISYQQKTILLRDANHGSQRRNSWFFIQYIKLSSISCAGHRRQHEFLCCISLNYIIINLELRTRLYGRVGIVYKNVYM